MNENLETLQTLGERLKYAIAHEKSGRRVKKFKNKSCTDGKEVKEGIMSQRDIAAVTGYSNTAISQYCTGQRRPSKRAVVSISEALNNSYEWLMFGEGTFEDNYNPNKIYDTYNEKNLDDDFEPEPESVGASARVIVRKHPAGGAWIEFYLDKNNYRDMEKQILV